MVPFSLIIFLSKEIFKNHSIVGLLESARKKDE